MDGDMDGVLGFNDVILTLKFPAAGWNLRNTASAKGGRKVSTYPPSKH